MRIAAGLNGLVPPCGRGFWRQWGLDPISNGLLGFGDESRERTINQQSGFMAVWRVHRSAARLGFKTVDPQNSQRREAPTPFLPQLDTPPVQSSQNKGASQRDQAAELFELAVAGGNGPFRDGDSEAETGEAASGTGGGLVGAG